MKRKMKESKEDLRKRARSIVRLLRKRYPRATTALRFSAPHELLVATVLAAQSTDKKVNEITGTLFRKYKGPADFARARKRTLEKEIRSAGFFRSKTKSIIARGDPRVLRDTSDDPQVRSFFNRLPLKQAT